MSDVWKWAEREAARVARENGHPYAERRLRLGAHTDGGDLDGMPRALVDVKAHKQLRLSTWLDEAVEEAKEGVTAVVVVRRLRRPASDWYAVLRWGDFCRLTSEEEA